LPDPEPLERAKAVKIVGARAVEPTLATDEKPLVYLSFLRKASKARKNIQVRLPQDKPWRRCANLDFHLDAQKAWSWPTHRSAYTMATLSYPRVYANVKVQYLCLRC
jgi:hypothetical protein